MKMNALHPGGNPGADLKSISRGNRWFLKSTPIQMLRESDGFSEICPWVASGVVEQEGSRSQGIQVRPLVLSGLFETRTASAALAVSERQSESENERGRARERK